MVRLAFLEVAFVVALSLLASVGAEPIAPAGMGVAIALGTTEVEGGGTEGPSVPQAAIDAQGSTGTGHLTNGLSVEMSDMTCVVEDGTAGNFSFNGETGAFEASGDGEEQATVTFDPGSHVDPGQEFDYSVTEMSVTGGGGGAVQPLEGLQLHFVPSTEETINSVAVESNPTPAYQLSEISDLARSGLERAYHPAITAWVENVDPSRDLVGITGSIGFPGGFSANVLDVELQQPGGVPLAHDVSVDGNEFTISNFSGREPGNAARIVFLLDGTPDGDPVQVTLEAAFTP